MQRLFPFGERNRPTVQELQMIQFLEMLLANGAGTLDDATDDLSQKFDDGGKWRGGIPLSLSIRGVIVKQDYRLSSRPSRHGSPVAVWRLENPGSAKRLLKRLKSKLPKENPSDDESDGHS